MATEQKTFVMIVIASPATINSKETPEGGAGAGVQDRQARVIG